MVVELRKTLVHSGCQRHQHPTALHMVGSEHLGGWLVKRARHERLAIQPWNIRHLDKIWGTHSIDRFASMENEMLPRRNSRWRDPRLEATDCLRLDDNLWRKEKNWCNPPWELMNELVAKMHRSGAAATVVAPHCVGESWHQLLLGLSTEVIIYPLARDLFFPGRHGAREGVGMPNWSNVACKVPFRHGCTLSTDNFSVRPL